MRWLFVALALAGCHRHRGYVTPHPKVTVTVWPARPHEIPSDRVTEVTIEHARTAHAVVVDANERPLSGPIAFERVGESLHAIVPRRAIAPHIGPAILRVERETAVDHVDLGADAPVWSPARIEPDDPQATLVAIDDMRGAAPDPALADAMGAEAAFAVGRTFLAELFATRGLTIAPPGALERRLLRVRIAAAAEARNDPSVDRARLAASAIPAENALDRALDLRLAELHDRNEAGPRAAPAAALALIASDSVDAGMLCRAGAIERGMKLATRTADKAICLVRAADAATDAGKSDVAERLYAEATALLGDRFLPREQREAWYSAAYLAEDRGDLATAFERARIACTWVDRLTEVERELAAREALSGNLLSYFVAAMRLGMLAKKAESAIAIGEMGKGRVLAAMLRGKSGLGVGAHGPWFEAPAYTTKNDLTELRARLRPDEVVLTYARLGHNAKGEGELAIGVVKATEVTGKVVVVPDDLDALIASHAQAVVNAEPRAKELGARLEALLLAPVRAHLARRILVSPHLALHGVAWPALHDGERWLVERHELARVPPLTAFRHDPPKKPAHWVSAIAPPHPPLGALPGFEAIADRLVKPIAPRFDLRGRTVTAERLTSSLKNADALLYAGHAEYDSMRPLESALLVSNGTIRATDLLRVDRPLDVVVLVGCETGRTVDRKPSFADEAIGLPRAFLASGARQVVGALLPVVDRDAEDFASALFGEPITGDLVTDVATAQRCMISGACMSRGPSWGTYVVDLR